MTDVQEYKHLEERAVSEANCTKRFGLLRTLLVVAVAVMVGAASIASMALAKATAVKTRQESIQDDVRTIKQDVKQLLRSMGRLERD